MQIQVNSGPNIQAHDALIASVSEAVEGALGRYRERITRVEAHLSDQNSDKKGGPHDMRCTLEARLEGRKPLAVTHQAATLDLAVDGATEKMAGMIENLLDRQRDLDRQRTDPLPAGVEGELQEE